MAVGFRRPSVPPSKIGSSFPESREIPLFRKNGRRYHPRFDFRQVPDVESISLHLMNCRAASSEKSGELGFSIGVTVGRTVAHTVTFCVQWFGFGHQRPSASLLSHSVRMVRSVTPSDSSNPLAVGTAAFYTGRLEK